MIWYFKGNKPDADNCLARCKAYLAGACKAMGIDDRPLDCAGIDRVHDLSLIHISAVHRLDVAKLRIEWVQGVLQLPCFRILFPDVYKRQIEELLSSSPVEAVRYAVEYARNVAGARGEDVSGKGIYCLLYTSRCV